MWQNVGERRYTEKQKPRMVDGIGGEGSGEEAGYMYDDELGIRDREEQPPTSLRHLYGQTKKADRGRWTEHGGVCSKNCTESLTKTVAKILYSRWHGIELRMEGT